MSQTAPGCALATQTSKGPRGRDEWTRHQIPAFLFVFPLPFFPFLFSRGAVGRSGLGPRASALLRAPSTGLGLTKACATGGWEPLLGADRGWPGWLGWALRTNGLAFAGRCWGWRARKGAAAAAAAAAAQSRLVSPAL